MAWAYCHVPNGSTVDMSDRIEAQIERFAPGFRDRVLARHTFSPVEMEAHNANYLGGDISGGRTNLGQLAARPVASTSPWRTPIAGPVPLLRVHATGPGRARHVRLARGPCRARRPGPGSMARMTAVAMRVRAELRGRWTTWLLLAVLVGAFAGAVIGVIAGARRTDTAYARLVRRTHAPDFVVVMDNGNASFAKFTPAQMAQLPGVASHATFTSFASVHPANIVVAGPTVDSADTPIWGRKILRGRNPRPGHPDEATMSFTAAEKYHKGPGDRFRVTLAGPTNQAVPVTLHIVGVDAAPGEFPPHSVTDSDTVWVGPGFARRCTRRPVAAELTALRLRRGTAGIPAVQTALDHLGKGRFNTAFALSWQGRNTQRSIHVQAVALWVLAGLLSLALLLVLTQLLARQSALESDGFRELHALGMTSRDLWAVGMARLVMIGVAGAVVAVPVAVAVSPLFPIGLAGIAEPRPGLHVDGWAIVLGALATLAVVAACGAWPCWRVARRASAASADDRGPGAFVVRRPGGEHTGDAGHDRHGRHVRPRRRPRS